MEGRDPDHRNGQKERWSTIYKIIQHKPQPCSVPETYRTELWWNLLFSCSFLSVCESIWSPLDITSADLCVNRTMSMSAHHPAWLSYKRSVRSSSRTKWAKVSPNPVHFSGPVLPCTSWKNSKAGWWKSWLFNIPISLPYPLHLSLSLSFAILTNLFTFLFKIIF